MGMSPREVARVRARLVAIGLNLRELTEITSRIRTQTTALTARRPLPTEQDVHRDH